MKSAARTASGQPGHAGDRRGAPAFVAPSNCFVSGGGVGGLSPSTIPEVDDEGEFTGFVGSGGDAADEYGGDHDQGSLGSGSSQQSNDHSLQVDQVFESDNQSASEGGNRINNNKPGATVQSLLLASHGPLHNKQSTTTTTSPHVTRAALPAAIAAACRAGEDLDRQRVTGSGNTTTSSTGTSHKSPLIHLFKSTTHAQHHLPSLLGDEKKGDLIPSVQLAPSSMVPVHRRRSSGSDISGSGRRTQSMILPPSAFRRTSLDGSGMVNHRMPSEISLAETEKHANFGELSQELDALSDDDDELDNHLDSVLGEEQPDKEEDANEFMKEAPAEPIVVMRMPEHVTLEETKAEEDEKVMSDSEFSRESMTAKAMKKQPRRLRKSFKTQDDDNFHFNGPRSVRNWVKRRRQQEEDKKLRTYVKGKVIDGQHELYTMSIAVMLGMRTSIGRTNMQMAETSHNDRRWLDPNDTMAVEKYVFPPRVSSD